MPSKYTEYAKDALVQDFPSPVSENSKMAHQFFLTKRAKWLLTERFSSDKIDVVTPLKNIKIVAGPKKNFFFL